MSTPAGGAVHDSQSAFTRGASRQLALIFLAAFAAIVLLLVLVGQVAGVSDGAEAVDEATQSISVAMTAEPPQLDSTKSTDQVSGQVLGHVMEGLLRYDAVGNVVPGVAERWDIRADGATFNLRADARWSDGSPVTAADFVFAWRRVVDPATASQYAFLMYGLRNAEAINQGKLPVEELGVRAVDDRTLEVAFQRPTPFFDKLAAWPTYLPIRESFLRARGERYGADATDLLYNGPFTIGAWVHGASLTLARNAQYWDRDAIRLQSIHFGYMTTDPNSALNLFKDGKIAVTGLSAETLPDALEQHWDLRKFADGSVFYLEFNHLPGRLTANRNLRRALQRVTDAGELVNRVIKIPGYLPGRSLFPVYLPGVTGRFREDYPAPEVPVDPEGARELLEQARQELRLERWPPLVLLTGDTDSARKQAEYFQDVYRRTLGLDVRIDQQTFKQRLARMTAGEFDMVMSGWGPDYMDPMTFADLFTSWNANNRGQYRNPELDRLVAVAQDNVDAKVRMDAFGAIQQILHDDAVVLPHYERVAIYVVHPQLQGLVRRVVGTDPDFTRAWVAPAVEP